jgi:hypothetical protein
MRRATPDGRQLLQLAGLVAAIVLAAVVNVLGDRHYTRWDWTKAGRWTLSPATIQTLQVLEQTVEVWVVAGPGDPLELSLRQLIASYQAQSSRLDVHWVDPDRDTVQLLDLQHRFGLEAGRTENGRIATDAIVIVESGDKHWFLTPQDLFETSADDVRVKPREERALTQAIRSVLGGDKAKLCFTTGHGELSLDAAKDEREWLGSVRDLLEKDNYELTSVDLTNPNERQPFAGCTVAIIAGARAPFGPEESSRLRAWLMDGGSLLAAVGPIESPSETGMTSAGLDDVLAPFGVALNDDLVHDVEPTVAIPETHGEGFLVEARPHPVTVSLVPSGSDAHPPRVTMFFARSLRHVWPADAAAATDLLATSGTAYAKRSIVGASSWADAPPREASDARGPFVLAMASERPGRGAGHGPRVVVVGSRFVLAEDNWRQPRPLHGAAFLVDSALSWLASRPEVVDVPEKPETMAAIRISEEGRDQVQRYVLVLMPLATLLLGLAVWAWRRSSENTPYKSTESESPS